jgi:hypothetical protein
MYDYKGENRRVVETLSEEIIEVIAERAAEKAMLKMTNQLYREVGRGIISKFLYLVGILTIAAWAWMHNNGWLK